MFVYFELRITNNEQRTHIKTMFVHRNLDIQQLDASIRRILFDMLNSQTSIDIQMNV